MNNMEKYQEGKTFKSLDLEDNELVGYEFVDCIFEEITFEDSLFRNSKFIDCQFIDCRFSNLVIKNSSMKDSSFKACHLIGINWNKLLGGGYSLPIESIDNCKLVYNNFMDIDFYKFDFSDNNIKSSFFADCDLSESSFFQCELDATEFFKCDLRGANFKEANGYIIDTSTNEVKGAKFSYPDVMNLLANLEIVID